MVSPASCRIGVPRIGIWNNSHLIKENVAEEITELKQQSGQDILVHGSLTLAQSLIEGDLVDQFNLLVYPLVLGSGKRLFGEGSSAKLKLVNLVPASFCCAIGRIGRSNLRRVEPSLKKYRRLSEGGTQEPVTIFYTKAI